MRLGQFVVATLALLASAPAASATVVHVVNQRGAAQLAQYSVDGGQWYVTSTAGDTPDLPAASVVRVSRRPDGGSCGPNPGGAPEGTAGVAYTVPDPAPPEAVVTLPDATPGSYKPESNDAERWLLGKINELRGSAGKPALAFSATLNRAADAAARGQAVFARAFPPPYCSLALIDWGIPTYSFGGVDAGGTDPRAAYAHWSDGSGRQSIVVGNWNAVGIGDGDGAYIAWFVNCSASWVDRCEMTPDQGDPAIVLPSPSPSSTPAPGATPAAGATPGPKGAGGPGTAPGTTVDALVSLTVKSRQRGKKVRGSVVVGVGGSNLVVRLSLGKLRVGKTQKAGVAAGRFPFAVALGLRGRKALATSGRLKLKIEVAVDPPTGSSESVTRTVTLRR